jgi:hypothetical protein
VPPVSHSRVRESTTRWFQTRQIAFFPVGVTARGMWLAATALASAVASA